MVAPPLQGNDIQQLARLFELPQSRIAYPSSCRGEDGTNRRIGRLGGVLTSSAASSGLTMLGIIRKQAGDTKTHAARRMRLIMASSSVSRHSRLQKHLILVHAKAGAEIRFTVAHIVSFGLSGQG
jgi:hypothetical protein